MTPGATRLAIPSRRLATLVLIALGATLASGASARLTLRRSNPPPGQLVTVHGRRMHVHCTGQGEPTVVLDAGLMDFSVLWSDVQAGAATFTRTCSYDRAGLGWSEPAPTPRTSPTAVTELRELLHAAGIGPGFVLVGHSYGGLNARRYAQRYPAEVAGLVLVDAAHEGQLQRIPVLRTAREATLRQFRFLSRLSSIGLLALMPRSIPDRGLGPMAARQYRRVLASPGYFHAAIAELAATDESFAVVASDQASLGDVPMVVIRRGQPAPVPGLTAAENAVLETEWAQMQGSVLALSTRATSVVATESSHDIHIQQPDLVVRAIRTVVDRARHSN